MVLKNLYNYKIDVWQLGMLLFEMLHGLHMTEMKSIEDIKQFLNKGLSIKNDLKFETKNLLEKLLEFDGEKRISVE